MNLNWFMACTVRLPLFWYVGFSFSLCLGKWDGGGGYFFVGVQYFSIFLIFNFSFSFFFTVRLTYVCTGSILLKRPSVF